MKKLYTATVNVTDGREGHAKSLDGNLDAGGYW
jgi:organic hydroperoxide reductase OsmC/OhrA